MDEIAGHITGISFKMSNIKVSTLKTSKLDKDLTEMIELVVDEVLKLNEVTRNLNNNSEMAIEIAQKHPGDRASDRTPSTARQPSRPWTAFPTRRSCC